LGHAELNRFPFLDFDRQANIVTLNLPVNFKDQLMMLYVTLADRYLSTTYNMPLSVVPPPEETRDESDEIKLDQQVILPQFLTDFIRPQITPEDQLQRLQEAQKSCVP